MKNFVVHQLLHHAVITHPEQVIVSDGKQFTFKQFYTRVVKLADSLSNQGVKKGTVIGVLDVNTHRFLEMHAGRRDTYYKLQAGTGTNGLFHGTCW